MIRCIMGAREQTVILAPNAATVVLMKSNPI